ncbi:hypothetical protein N7495_008147 [Penicillium taxi]|uniref:uncharacterized protein n=1 Tax=Penicillium taxi TaxID=168475 RepID=UPI0025453949|nr:uncharacterized protein N7495_008147 [Penicillium taxi]KAJ5888106.1 hypothetical protein N7495_008147 [Penicillium taxi]
MAMLSSPDLDPNPIDGFSNQFLEKYGVSVAVAQNRRANRILTRQIEGGTLEWRVSLMMPTSRYSTVNSSTLNKAVQLFDNWIKVWVKTGVPINKDVETQIIGLLRQRDS